MPNIKIGDESIIDAVLDGTPIQQAYLGDELLWQQSARYHFDGGDYVVIPGWEPLSKEYEIRVKYKPTSDVGMQTVWGASDHYYHEYNVGKPHSGFKDIDSNNIDLGDHASVDYSGDNYIENIFQANYALTGGYKTVSYNVNYQEGGLLVDPRIALEEAPDYPSAITRIGAAHSDTDLFTGTIYDVEFIDKTPLNNRYAYYGDDTAFTKFIDPIYIGPDDDFKISFDWLREDTGSQDFVYLVSSSTADDFEITAYDSDHASQADSLQFALGGTSRTFTDALQDIPLNKSVHIEFERLSNNLHCRVNHKQHITTHDLTGEAGTWDSSFASYAGDKFVNGYVGNFELTCPRRNTAKGFLEFGDTSHPDYLDHASLKSSSDLGQLEFIPVIGDDRIYDSVKGITHIGCALAYGTSFFIANPNLATEGFTLQYEIEKEAFATQGPVASSGPFGTFLSLFAGDENTLPAIGWPVDGTYLGGRDSTGFENTIVPLNTAYDDFVRVDISYNPSLGTFGQLDLYINKSWELSADLTRDPGDLTTIYTNGLGSLYALYNHPFYYRNVQLSLHPITKWAEHTKKVAAVGHDTFSRSGYALGDLANHNPPITGYGASEFPINPFMHTTDDNRNNNLYSFLHEAYIDNGMTIFNNKIDSYAQAAGKITSENAVLDGYLEKMVDSALGVPGAPISGGEASSYDHWIINVGYWDVNWRVVAEDTGLEDDYAHIDDVLMAEYKAQLDRIIADSPEMILVMEQNPAAVVDSYPEPERSRAQAMHAYFKLKLRELESYHPLISVVNLPNGYEVADEVNTMRPSPVNCRKLAEAIGEKLSDLRLTEDQIYTYCWSINEGALKRSHNTNEDTAQRHMMKWESTPDWQKVANNSRLYKINEGTGATIYDSYDKSAGQDNKGTITNFDENNWDMHL